MSGGGECPGAAPAGANGGAPRSGAGAWGARASLTAAAAVFGLTYGLAAPLVALGLAAGGLGETAIGANAAAYALGALGAAAWLPALARRWGARRVLAAGLVGVALALPAFPLLPWLWLWFPLRALVGLASESVFVTSESWVNALSDEASRARNVALYTAAVSAGFALGPAIVAGTGSAGLLPWTIGGALALVALALAPRSGSAPPRVEAAQPARSRLVLLRAAPVALAASALNAALETAGLSFLPLYAMRLGWSEPAAALLVSTLMVGAIVLQLPIGWLGDRVDRGALMLLLATLSAAGACAWPLVLGHPWLAHALVFAWGGAFVGVYTLAMTLVGSRFAGAELLAVYAALSFAWGLGALVGPTLGGAAMELARHGLPLFAAAACAAFALFAAVRRADA